jgi:SPP1 gp7 family putative phage head morphogenesis protein
MPAEFLFAPTPHTEAIDFIAGKPLVSREVFAGLLPELKARAFTIAGVENAAVCAGIRAKLAQLPAGVPWDKLKKQIADDLHPFLADPEEPGNRIAAERRAELLLRTHGFQAYQAAAYEVGERQADVFPFLEYASMGDGKVRPAHAALDGVILPRNHEFWKTHMPPWEWGCRCQAIPISADDHADAVAADAKKPEDKKNVLSDYAQQDLTATRRLVRNGVSYNVSSPAEKGKPGAFRSHPGDLRLSLEDLRSRYDAQTWAEFQAWAQGQALDGITTVGGPLRMEYVRGKTEQQGGLATVWDWLKGAKIAEITPAPSPASTGRRMRGSSGGGASRRGAEKKWTPREISEAEIGEMLAAIAPRRDAPAASEPGGEAIPFDPVLRTKLYAIDARTRAELDRHYARVAIYRREHPAGNSSEEVAAWSNRERKKIEAAAEAERRKV